MSVLIDTLYDMFTQRQLINGKWVVAKPIYLCSLKQRIKDAFRVLCGTSQAFHYVEDDERSFI